MNCITSQFFNAVHEFFMSSSSVHPCAIHVLVRNRTGITRSACRVLNFQETAKEMIQMVKKLITAMVTAVTKVTPHLKVNKSSHNPNATHHSTHHSTFCSCHSATRGTWVGKIFWASGMTANGSLCVWGPLVLRKIVTHCLAVASSVSSSKQRAWFDGVLAWECLQWKRWMPVGSITPNKQMV